MKRSLLFALLCTSAFLVKAQTLKEVFRIAGACDAFTTDEMQGIYVLRENTIELYDQFGDLTHHNSLRQFGRISLIDATFALRPTVYSKGQSQLAQLDNTLSVQGTPIDLRQMGPVQISVVCTSVQNAFWLFDERELAINRVDNQLRIFANTGRLDQLLGFTPHPSGMQEWDNRLYVNDPEHGVLVFDLFGTYMRMLPITGAESIEVRGNGIFSFGHGALQRYDMVSFATEPIPLPQGIIALDARLERRRLILRTAEAIIVYEVE